MLDGLYRDYMMILATIFVVILPAFPAPAHTMAAGIFQKGSGIGLSSPAPSQAPSSPVSSTPNPVSPQSQTVPETPDIEKVKTTPSSVPSTKQTKTKKVKKQAAEKSVKDSEKTRIVRHGSTPEPALKFAPTLSQEQLAQQRQHTTELLAASDANLKNTAGRQLSPAQQDTVSKVRNYMQQATAADKSGDMQRAQALASKAKQLSDDLVSH